MIQQRSEQIIRMLTIRARYCLCESPCLSFLRIALEASAGLLKDGRSQLGVTSPKEHRELPSGLEVDGVDKLRNAAVGVLSVRNGDLE